MGAHGLRQALLMVGLPDVDLFMRERYGMPSGVAREVYWVLPQYAHPGLSLDSNVLRALIEIRSLYLLWSLVMQVLLPLSPFLLLLCVNHFYTRKFDKRQQVVINILSDARCSPDLMFQLSQAHCHVFTRNIMEE